MRRWDPTLSGLTPLTDYPILGPSGDLMRFDKLPKKAPWNVAAVALRGRKWMTLKDLLKVDVRRALAMLSTGVSGVMTARAPAYLDGLRFPPDARRMLGLHALEPDRAGSLAERLLDLQVTAPFAVWRLFLDRQPNADRDQFAGTAGLGRLDNISIYKRIEAESRAYAQHTGNSVVELHAYGLDPIGEPELKAELRAGLDRLYPELAGARVVHDEWLLRQDCPAFPPGSYTGRPTVRTNVQGLALAGDFVHLPFPSALMERAAASGILAAHTLLTDGARSRATSARTTA